MEVVNSILGFGGHGRLDPSYVCIHETAGPGAPAVNLVSWWRGGGGLPVHYVGDWTGKCYHCVPEDEVCWQVGNGNPYVIGIELCHATNRADFDKVWQLGVEWAAWQLSKRGWGVDRLLSHYDCTVRWGGSDHTDPIGYFEEYGKSWNDFKEAVGKMLENDGKWEQKDGKWWYRRADGSWPAGEWSYIDGKWYLFDDGGYMLSGWQWWQGDWYYLQPQTKATGTKFGHMLTGWQDLKWKGGTNRFWFDKSGKMNRDAFRLVGTKWYAFDDDGCLVKDDARVSVNPKSGAITVA